MTAFEHAITTTAPRVLDRRRRLPGGMPPQEDDLRLERQGPRRGFERILRAPIDQAGA